MAVEPRVVFEGRGRHAAVASRRGRRGKRLAHYLFIFFQVELTRFGAGFLGKHLASIGRIHTRRFGGNRYSSN